MTIPNNIPQLLILLIFVIPGSVYQAVRSRLRGPTPDEQDVTNRVLRAIGFSAGLNAIYAVVLGPSVVELVTHAPSDPRDVALVGLVLMVALPALLAYINYLRLERGWTIKTTYDPTPSAWDFMFQNREECFIRVRTREGQWVGGWFGTDSYASSFPEPRDLFIQSAYRMEPDGSFGDRLEGTVGVYVQCSEVDVVEFLTPASEEEADGPTG